MGNNKKARSKNRKNAKPKTQHRNARTIRSSKYFHPDDDLEGLLKHVHAKEIGYQKLAKYVPRTLQKVKEQERTTADFVSSLVTIYQMSYFPLLNEEAVLARVCNRFAEKALQFMPHYKDLVSEDEVLKFSRYMQFLVSNKVVSEHIKNDAANENVVNSTKTTDLAGGDDGNGDKLNYLTTPGYYLLPHSLYADMVSDEFKTAIDSTCKAWAKRMDGLMCNGSHDGDFLSRCPVYARTRRELFEIKRRILEETASGREALAVEELRRWASCFSCELLFCIHDVKKSCWECGKVCQTCFYSCGCCETANYCNEACQKQAWESGHSKSCERLHVKHDFLKDSILLVDEKHKEQIASGSGTPPAMCDYAILPSLIDNETFKDLNESFKNVGASMSMSNFYSNLERVQRGEWWIIDQAPTLEVYLYKVGRLDRRDSEKEAAHFFSLARLMTVDWTTFSETTKEELRRDILEGFTVHMPAKRFLQLYNKFCSWGFPVGGSGRKQTRRFLVKNALASLRASYHKISDTATVVASEVKKEN